jgi:hypothetical protein
MGKEGDNACRGRNARAYVLAEEVRKIAATYRSSYWRLTAYDSSNCSANRNATGIGSRSKEGLIFLPFGNFPNLEIHRYKSVRFQLDTRYFCSLFCGFLKFLMLNIIHYFMLH